jgi:hypothetical protein
MGITAEVFDATGVTSIRALTEAFDYEWTDELGEDGLGSLDVHHDGADLTAAPSLKDVWNIVRVSIDGTERFGFIIEKPAWAPAPTGEKAEDVYRLQGRSVLTILEDAAVDKAPEAPIKQEQRTFGWMYPDYDDSSWIAATQLQRQDATGPDTAWPTWPREWPDPTAYWIWSQTFTGSSPIDHMPVGTSYFRKKFTLAVETVVVIAVACDNGDVVWLDDEPIVSFTDDDWAAGWHTWIRYDIKLEAGDHTIAVSGTNLAGAAGHTHNPAGLLMSIMQADKEAPDGIATPRVVILHTDSSWKALDYPPEPPGMTPGEIFRILVAEAQARGCFPALTLSFTDADDTDGTPWTIIPEVAFDVGRDLLLAAKHLSEFACDIGMTPTLVFDAWVKDGNGSDLTGTVNLLVGQDFADADTHKDPHFASALLVRIQDGSLAWIDDTPGHAPKRRESYLELGSSPSQPHAQTVSEALFADFGGPTITFGGTVVAESGPYTVWRPGDTILAPNQDGAPTPTTVVSLSVKGNSQTGEPEYTIQGMQDA